MFADRFIVIFDFFLPVQRFNFKPDTNLIYNITETFFKIFSRLVDHRIFMGLLLVQHSYN